MAGDAAAAVGSEAGQEAGGQEAGGAADLSGITGQLQEMAEGQSKLFQMLQQSQQQAQPQEQDEPEAIDLAQYLAGQDPMADPQEQAQQLQAQIQEMINRGVEERLNPLSEQFTEMRHDLEAERLAQEFPVFGENPEAAEQMIKTSYELANARGWGAKVAGDPQFWRMNTLAAIGLRSLQDEQSQAPQGDGAHAATLEGASGAVPGGSGPDLAQQVLEPQRRGSAVLDF